MEGWPDGVRPESNESLDSTQGGAAQAALGYGREAGDRYGVVCCGVGDIKLCGCARDGYRVMTSRQQQTQEMCTVCLVLESHIQLGILLVWECQSDIGMCMGNPGPDGGQASDQP